MSNIIALFVVDYDVVFMRASIVKSVYGTKCNRSNFERVHISIAMHEDNLYVYSKSMETQ